MKSVLIIEDDSNIRTILGYHLMKIGYSFQEAENGKDGLNMALNNGPFDLILIDWMLPNISGIEIVKKCREANVPSILFMLTARSSEEDMIEAFEAGVDDFIYKPFSIKLLQLKIEAHLKHRLDKKHCLIKFEDICLDTNKRAVFVQNKHIHLTKKEFDFLEYFLNNPNVVISRDQILNELWGFDYENDTRIVDVHIYKLRNKLKDSNAIIHSSRGIGYILESKNGI